LQFVSDSACDGCQIKNTMKLLYLANARIPTEKAHGLQIFQMCEAFAENGCDVALVGPKRVNSITQNPWQYYDVQKNFSYSAVPCLDLIFLDANSLFFLIQTITFLFSTKIISLFKKYDVVYTREQLVGLFFQGHILEMHSIPKRVVAVHRFLWRRAKKIVVLTSYIKSSLVKEGVQQDKIIVSPDGVNLAKFDISLSKKEAREGLKLPQDAVLVGYVGMLRTLGMEKGIETVLRALQALRDDSIRFVVVGGHMDDVEFYRHRAEALGIAEAVIFVGRVSHSLIPAYLKAFDVLVAPFPKNEHYMYYMSPMKIFEYMASGRPIIASRLPSIEEVIGRGEAMLVTPDDVVELAEGLKKILYNEDVSVTLAEKALFSVQKYTWIERAKNILAEI